MECVNKKCSEDFLIKVAAKIVDWKALAPHLGMTTAADAVVIERDGDGENGKRRKLLQMWLQRNGPDATYYRLIEAFIDAEDKDTADEICKYLAGISSHAAVTVLYII